MPLVHVSLKMRSWSSKALFASHHTARGLATRRMQEFKRLCSGHQLVAIQETHGSAMDEMTLAREVPTHLHALSVIPDRAAGGVSISIERRFLAMHFTSHYIKPVVPGRVLLLHVDGPCGSLDIFSIHLDPNMKMDELTFTLNEIKAHFNSDPPTPSQCSLATCIATWRATRG